MGDGDRRRSGDSGGPGRQGSQGCEGHQGRSRAEESESQKMTFSIAGRCATTGMFGVAITTSSIAVTSRCPWARAGVGAVSTQNVTDPSIGPRTLDLMAKGASAPDALAKV